MNFLKHIASLISVVLLATGVNSAFAAEASSFVLDTNVTEGYKSLLWSGDKMSYDESSETVFFSKNGTKTDYSASWTLEFSETIPKELWFYADIGNGNSTDTAGCMMEIIGADGKVLLTATAADIHGKTNYSRYSVGEEESYCAVPADAKSVRITLSAKDKDGGEAINAYFRNITLFFSDSKAVKAQSNVEMAATDGLTLVEIGTTDFTRWVWVGIIFVVALIFYFIRVKRGQYKTTKILKP